MKNKAKDFIFGVEIVRKSWLNQFSIGAVALAVMQVAQAQANITNIVPMQLPGQGTELRVMFNGLPSQPAAYQLENPSRLILDFNQAKNTLKQTNIPIATKEAKSVDISADSQRSRLTVNLAEAGAFTTRVEGNTFILKINPANAAVTPTPTTAKAPVQPAKPVKQKGIADINFQRGSEGDGQVVIDLLGSDTPVDVQQKGSKIIVRFLGTKIPENLARRLNVNDFATPVSIIDAYNDGSNGVISIQSTGPYEYMAYQAEDRLTVSLKKPVDKNVVKPSASQVYTGQKISLDFQDIEVRRVLQLLADFTNVNMVAADSVNGNISLRLKDVPWDQALDIILKAKKFR